VVLPQKLPSGKMMDVYDKDPHYNYTHLLYTLIEKTYKPPNSLQTHPN
jgi:hypothetical protein